MLGSAEEWAPNAGKNGAISLTGKRVWNKSEVFRWVKSLVDAGFPKNLVSDNLAVFAGSDVHVNRITQEGDTYTDKKTGQQRQRTTMLVTKVYATPTAKGAKAAPATKGAAAAAPVAENTEALDNDLIILLTEAISDPKNAKGLPIDKVKQEVFIRATRAKKSAAERTTMQERAVDGGFLASLAEQGLIGFDGKTVSAAA